MALLNPPLSQYQCSPPCHVQRSFLSPIFLIAALDTVAFPSFLKQLPLSPHFLPTILLSLAEFTAYFLLLNDGVLFQVYPIVFSGLKAFSVLRSVQHHFSKEEMGPVSS